MIRRACIALAGCWLLFTALGDAGPAFDGHAAFRHVERIVRFGPRPSGSDALARTRRYLVEELTRGGLKVREEAFTAQTPDGPIKMVNVVGEVKGRRPDVILIGGHYDTKYFRSFRFVGANDGGSSSGLLLTLARALAQTASEFTYWIVFFDGEEARREWSRDDSLYGSRSFVRSLQANGQLKRLRAVIVVDMIGDRDLGIRREGGSTPWLTGLIWQTANRLGYGRHFLDAFFPVEDDHAPFMEVGVPGVLLIDFDYGGRPGENAFWHTPEDTLDKVSTQSLRIVGEVLLESLRGIERTLSEHLVPR
jgi:Zn-dependent M28 family amino/carboxypeptidase